ncbi:dihydrolipoamide acetyltransferase family protein [Nocardia higoensis]|uniref:dihydrolipoamide acetyltransferase family protein n=1 Tax=Nocardia higoensis TaxID=228599 RepID=UPI0002FB73BC|nr:dihydrolipoamide acetyltransferase family protein [Nocardia higoensis]
MHDDGAILEFRLPDLGEGLADAELVSWSVEVGDHVDLNQVIAEVETAKAVVALPCPYAGTVAELVAEPGETIPVGATLIRVRDEGANEHLPEAHGDSDDRSVAGATRATAEGLPGAGGAAARSAVDADHAAVSDTDSAAEGTANGDGPADGRNSVLVGYGPQDGFRSRRRGPTGRVASEERAPGGRVPVVEDGTQGGGQAPAAEQVAPAGGRVRAVPAARRLAKELGVDLGRIAGSGPDGAVTAADVRAAAAVPTAAAGRAATVAQAGEQEPGSGEIRTPVTGVRKRTAAAMVTSATTIPQASTSLTVDCTATVEAVEHLRATPSFTGLSLTPLTFLARAVLVALAEYPAVNAHFDEQAQQIVTKKYVNLGIAAATERGLLVPNVKQAQTMSVRTLCEALGRCVEAARSGTATPADLTGGTFTLSNVGVFGVDAGTPLVNPGEAAILCLGTIARRPWVVEGELAIRRLTTLTMSFDHRLVDGELAARFLATVGALLTDPLTLLSR